MTEKKHSHYFRDVSRLEVIDVYRLLELFEVTCPVAQHIVKKALAAGKRGAKSPARDMQDIVDSAQRWLAMREEDAQTPRDLEKWGTAGNLFEAENREMNNMIRAALDSPGGGFIKTSFTPMEQAYKEADPLTVAYNLTKGAA